jgi:phosphatidylglycerophosphatase A
MRTLLGQVVGTCLGVGFVPVVPATWTSLVVAVAFVLVPLAGWPLQSAVLAVVLVLGVPACSALERRYGEDPKQATIDEAAGMLLTLLAVPPTWFNALVAFLLFRIFDIVKIPPARQAERLPAGWGIMADDVIAGMQARVVMAVVLWVAARTS